MSVISKLLDLIPNWVLVVAIVLLSVFVGTEAIRLAHARELVAEARAQVKQGEADLAAYKLSVSETARLLQASNDRNHIAQLNKVQEAANAAQLREQKALADSARLSSALARLRDAVRLATGGNPVPSAPSGAAAAPASAVGDVLLECAAAYGEMAKAADGHASDVQTLTESWPK